MKQSLQVILLFIVFLVSYNICAQQLNINYLTVKEGLPSNTITAITQDNNGYLWIGTENGLARYNGEKFTIYNQLTGLADNGITSLFSRKNNALWIGHSNGSISKIENSIISAYWQTEFNNYSISGIKETNDEKLVFQVKNKGLFSYSNDSTLINWMSGVDSIYLKSVNDFLFTSNHLIIATNNGLLITTEPQINVDNKFSILNSKNSALKSDIINSIFSIDSNEILIGTKEGLYRYRTKSKELKSFFISKNESLNIDKIFICNELIFGTDQYNLYQFDTNSRNYTYPIFKNPDDRINTVYSDDENNIWIGTNIGLLKYINKELVFYNPPELINHKINSIRLINDVLWIGSNNGVKIVNQQNINKAKIFTLLENKEVNFLYPDSRGNIWIGLKNSKNLYRYEKKSQKLVSFTNKNGYKLNDCNIICEDKNGVIFLFSTKNQKNQFYKYSTSTKKRSRSNQMGVFSNNLEEFTNPDDAITYAYRDTKANIWLVGKKSGLMMYDGQTIKYFEENNEISQFKISAIYEDKNEIIWISTLNNGIYKYNGVYFKNLGANEGLITKRIYTVISDHFDNLWLCTDVGLVRYDQYAESFYNYLDINKFRFSERSLICKNDEDNIWITSENNLIKIVPEKLVFDEMPPKCLIEDVYLNHQSIKKEYKLGQKDVKIDVPENTETILICYSGIKFNREHRVSYEYQMEGIEDDWQKTEENKVNFTKIVPGKYTFKVRSSTDNKSWSNMAILNFKVRAPIHRQIWFYLIILAGVISLIYLFIILRIRYFKKINIKLKENYADRTAQLSSAYNNIESNIKYAKNIQSAILRSEADLANVMPASFVFSQPKENMGGDFLWYARKSRNLFIAVADCVGHGVSGAFMSLIGHNILNHTINEFDSFDPPYILEEVSKNFSRTIKKTNLEFDQINDMDIAFCRIDRDRKEIIFSGANSTIYFIQKNKLHEFKGNARSIGQDAESASHFSRFKIKFSSGDILYLFTNGFADQFGGPDNKRYRSTRLKNLLVNVHDLPFEEQKKQVSEAFEKWKGKADQLDDVLIAGIRL